jgi:hypothetical protein
VATPAHFDTAYLEPIINGKAGDFTTLHDVTVVAAGGDRVELTGRVEQQRHLRPEAEPPEADGFRLSLHDDTVIAHCRTVDGFFRERPGLLDVQLEDGVWEPRPAAPAPCGRPGCGSGPPNRAPGCH